jgi:hypothetical protein
MFLDDTADVAGFLLSSLLFFLPALPEEEDEDDVDPFEFLLKIPCFGKPIYDKLEELTQGP